MSAQKDTTEVTFYRGRKFARYPLSPYNANHYFRPSKIDDDRRALHQVVWEDANGPVPDGFQIHHRDEDKTNNDLANLQLVRTGKHISVYHPGNIRKAGEAAKHWHSSPEGQAWHSEHARDMCFGNTLERELVCEECGQPFRTKKPVGARFCSNSCKSRWRRKSDVDNEQRVCVVCGSTFSINRYEPTRTCSRSCSGKLAASNRAGNRPDRAGIQHRDL